MFRSSGDEIVEVGGPLDHMGKLRHRAVKEATRGHTAKGLSNQVFCPNPRIGFFSLPHPTFPCRRLN